MHTSRKPVVLSDGAAMVVVMAGVVQSFDINGARGSIHKVKDHKNEYHASFSLLAVRL